MGVIVIKDIPLTNTLITKTIPLHNAGYVTVDGSGSINYLRTGSYDLTVYRVFSAITPENLLENPAIIRTELDLFIKYAEMLTLNEEVPPGFEELNLYLGSLGV